MDDLIVKLRNLQVMLEDANNRNAQLEIRHLITQIKLTVEEIELKRSVEHTNSTDSNN